MLKCFSIAIMLALSGCASLPSTGPSVSAVTQYNGAQVVPVDALTAKRMLTELQTAEATGRRHILSQVTSLSSVGDYQIRAGDKLTITLASFSPTGVANLSAAWPVQVSGDGMISLPYLKTPIQTQGHTLPTLRSEISRRYVQGKVFLAPAIQVTLDTDGSVHGILVTGSVGNPKIIPWVPGGISLAQAITISLGDGSRLSSQQNALNGSTSATSVTLIRKGQDPVTLPIDDVVTTDIPLQMDDKIIVNHKPAVQVTVMGGGIVNGLLEFGQHPSLAQAIAQSKGLDPTKADARSVFVLRDQDKPVLYTFAFKTTDAHFAAQQFPLMDGDIVYVSQSSFVTVAQVMAAIWPIASLAQVVR